MGQQRVHQGAARVARGGVDYHARRLVQHQEMLVLEHDIERARLGLRQRRSRDGQVHRIALPGFDPARALGYHRVVPPDLAGFDQILKTRSRQLRQTARQELIEALAGIVRAGRRGQDAAHHWRLPWTTSRASSRSL
jgi:hypothetical protein